MLGRRERQCRPLRYLWGADHTPVLVSDTADFGPGGDTLRSECREHCRRTHVPQELVLELREQETFKPLFKADDRSGGGTQPGSLGGGGGVTRLTKAEWTDKVGRAKPDERKKLMQDLSAGKYRVTD